MLSATSPGVPLGVRGFMSGAYSLTPWPLAVGELDAASLKSKSHFQNRVVCNGTPPRFKPHGPLSAFRAATS